MANPSAPTKSESGRPDHLINAEADKVLGKIVIGHFIAFAVLLLATTYFMAYLNIPSSRFYSDRHFLDFLSILVVMTPFFLGTNKFFKTRLQYGRDYVEQKRWKEAVASLEAFNHIGQRFLDPSGEAHYLLSLALAKEGRQKDADKVKDYVLKSHPSSPWSERFRKSEQAKPKAASIAKASAKTAVPAAAAAEEKPKKAAKPKRRRF
jgi:tetratricopeptide (TPR) repeat protein